MPLSYSGNPGVNGASDRGVHGKRPAQGVCTAIMQGMVAAGMSKEEAQARFIIVDHEGALGLPDGSATGGQQAHTHAQRTYRTPQAGLARFS